MELIFTRFESTPVPRPFIRTVQREMSTMNTDLFGVLRPLDGSTPLTVVQSHEFVAEETMRMRAASSRAASDLRPSN